MGDGKGRLKGIFTGRDAVCVIARGKDAADLRLSTAMTKGPMIISPASHVAVRA